MVLLQIAMHSRDCSSALKVSTSETSDGLWRNLRFSDRAFLIP